jgi:hypothetical protein
MTLSEDSQDGDPTYIRLLEADDELAETIPAEDREIARRKVTARLLTFEPDDRTLVGYTSRVSLGLLIMKGFVTRDVAFCGQESRELIGPGDLLRPWDLERDFLPPFTEVDFTVIEKTTCARLDHDLLALGSRWPRFVDELIHRAIDRSRWLAARLAITSAIRVDKRLLLFFWLSAGRWGRITPEGVLLPFSFTHSVLAELVGAQRPTITTALGELHARGEIDYIEDGPGTKRTLLTGTPPTGQIASELRRLDRSGWTPPGKLRALGREIDRTVSA